MSARMRTFLWASVFLVGTLPLAGQSTMTLTPTASFSPGFQASAVLVEQVVGGPFEDMLVTNPNNNSLRIIENFGPAVPPTAIDLSVGNSPQAIETADVDGDGDIDVITGGISNTTVLRQTAPGIFTRSDYALSAVGRIVVADLNGDGIRDLARGAQAAMATAPGVFGAVVTLVALSIAPIDTAIADFDGDGNRDLLIAELGSTGVTLRNFRGTGTGTFLPAVVTTTIIGGSTGFAMSAADLNADGRADVACSASNVLYASAAVLSFLGEPTGTFTMTGPAGFCVDGVPNNAARPIVGDFDGDGTGEVLVRFEYVPCSGFCSEWINVIGRAQNDGNGGFYGATVVSSQLSSPTYSLPPLAPFDLGDLDGDGDQDLLYRVSSLSPDLFLQVALGSYAQPALSSGAVAVTILEGAQIIGAPYSPQLVRARVVDAAGNGCPFVQVTLAPGNSGLTASVVGCLNRLTDSLGEVKFDFSLGSQIGAGTATLIVDGLAPVSVGLDVRALTLSMISGDNQTIAVAGHPPAPVTPPAPIVVRVSDPVSGSPVQGVSVVFSHPFGNFAFPLPQTLVTNASGEVTLPLSPIYAAGQPTSVVASFGNNVGAVTFIETVLGPSVTILSGGNQATDTGEAFPDPIEIEVRDYLGNPAAGIPVTMMNPTNQIGLSVPAPTDAFGRTVVTASSTFANGLGGAYALRATVPSLTAGPMATLFLRRLFLSGGASVGGLTVTYQHEDGPTPLILAVDQPQPSGISTPYGTIHTSVLAPAPTLLLADSQGLVGTFDPGLVANPTFSRTYSIPPAAAGFTFVAQIYGFDPTYYPDLSQAIFVSNAVTTTL